MRYGLNIPAAGECGDPRILSALARLAEDSGWDAVFLEDYLVYRNAVYQSVPDVPTYDPWVALAAMATSTERVKLGTTITPLPRRRPWKLAREAVSVDHLSDGRMVLGVGAGDMADEGFTRFDESTDPKERAGLLDEGLDVLSGLWTGRPFSYAGEHHTISEVTFRPRPVQAPRIPIWIGGVWPREKPLRRALRWDGFIPYKHVEGDERQQDLTPQDVAEIRAEAERRHPDPGNFDIVVGGGSVVKTGMKKDR